MIARIARIWPLIALTSTVHIIVHFTEADDPYFELGTWIADYIFKVSLTSGFTS